MLNLRSNGMNALNMVNYKVMHCNSQMHIYTFIWLCFLILNSGHSPSAVQIRHFLFTNHVGVTRGAQWSLRPALRAKWLRTGQLLQNKSLTVDVFILVIFQIGKHLCALRDPVCVSLTTFSTFLMVRFVRISLSIHL